MAVWFQTILMTKNFVEDPVNGPRAAIVAREPYEIRPALQPSFTLETAYMKKLLAVLVAGLFTAGAFAQAPAAAPATTAPAAAPMTAQAAAPATNKVVKKKTHKKVAKKKTAHKAA
jgi:hypothetical protein